MGRELETKNYIDVELVQVGVAFVAVCKFTAAEQII
jgi:hypothetical protein